MRTDEEPGDFFYQLDDPAFLAERARLRSRLEHVPENAIGRPRLERLYDAMTEEFCRRARIAWTVGRLPARDDVDRVRPRGAQRVDCAIHHALTWSIAQSTCSGGRRSRRWASRRAWGA
jgi:hypothetical protein